MNALDPGTLPELERKFRLVKELYEQAINEENEPVFKHYAPLFFKYESLIRLNSQLVPAGTFCTFPAMAPKKKKKADTKVKKSKKKSQKKEKKR